MIRGDKKVMRVIRHGKKRVRDTIRVDTDTNQSDKGDEKGISAR